MDPTHAPSHVPTHIMKQLFASFVLGDTPGVMELVHPEGEFVFPGDPAILPWAGRWRGPAFERFIDAVKDSLDYLEYTVLEFLPVDEQRVVVRALERVRSKATGRAVVNPHIGVATVVDGLFFRWEEYSDTAALERGFW